MCVSNIVPHALSPSQVKVLAILSYQVHARMDVRFERKRHLHELSVKRELTNRLKISNDRLTAAGQELKQLFVQLEQARLQHTTDERELQRRCELDSLKSEYVAMVSHELRSPLTSVRGAIGILSAGLVGPVNEKSAKLFNIALTNLDRMLRLVDDVLNLERMASGTASLQVQQCSLCSLVQHAIETMTPIAQESGVELTLNAETQTGNLEDSFYGDADKILQVLINLLSNAIKFSPRGAKVLLDIQASADKLKVRIADEGRGIPEDQLEKVFERFRQVDQDDARRLGGTGLGLAICRAIVQQHGGEIWAERNAVKGTAFFVTLSAGAKSLES